MELVEELKRRNVFRVAGLYVVGAWLLTQVATTVLPLFDVPGWALRALVILLALGFVPALVFSWMFELTPQGLKRESDLPASQPGAARNARLMDRLIMAVLALALTYFVFDKFVLMPRREAAQVAPSAPTKTPAEASSTAPAAAAPSISSKSIAVLAFTDLSPAKDHEYLSDGIAEEVLNALTRVHGLKVAGRTSSFHYKGRNEDLREIGKALGVAHVLEGSVRTQGDKVRITAQLIRTDDDFHLWSENYEGQLTDVFDLEDQIARKIVRELDVVLQGEDSARMVEVATTSSDAYALYLRATAVLNRREQPRYEEAIGWLDEAIRLDPNFARAYARSATLRAVAATPPPSMLAPAERYARHALELAPKLADAHEALARVYFAEQPPHTPLETRDQIEQAIALGPDDADINLTYAQLLLQDGYVKLGSARLDRTLAIDPLLPNALFWRGEQDIAEGRIDAARQNMERAEAEGLSWAKRGLFDLAKAQGDFDAARKWLDLYPRGVDKCGGVSTRDVPIDVQVGRPATAPQRAAALAVIERCLASKPDRIPFWVFDYLLQINEPQRALDATMAAPTQNQSGLRWRIWMPVARDVRALPGFAGFVRKTGWIDLWEKYGAPDLCHRVAPRDYACE